MYLCLHKLTSKYEKRIVLVFYIHCIKLEESYSRQIFTLILSRFSFVSNTTNYSIHSLSRFVLRKNCSRIAGILQSGALFISCICKYLVNWTEKKSFLISM